MFSVWLCSAGPLWTAFRLLRAISRVQTLNIIDGSPRRSSVSPQRSPVPAIGSAAEPRGTSKRPPDLVITATMRLRREHLPDGDTVRISHRGVPVVASMLPIMFSGSFAEMALSGRNAALGCFDEHNRPLNIEAGRDRVGTRSPEIRQQRGPRGLGELVVVADDPGDLQIRGCRVLASALLCRHSREEGNAPSFARNSSTSPSGSRRGAAERAQRPPNRA